jgi:hypothetical protein
MKATTVLRTKGNKSRARSVVQSVRLSKGERAALRLLARDQGLSVSEVVRAALRNRAAFRAMLERLGA